MQLPVLFWPEPDELYASYLLRLCAANNMTVREFHSNILGVGYVGYSTPHNMLKLFDELPEYYRSHMIDWLMAVTTLAVDSLAMNEATVDRFISARFYPVTGINVAYAGKSTDIRVCPECLKEHGMILRSHNISGVKVCWKHKIPLWSTDKLFDKYGKMRDFRAFREVECRNTCLEAEYAEFARFFLNDGVVYDYSKVHELLIGKIRSDGYGSNSKLVGLIKDSKYSAWFVKKDIGNFYRAFRNVRSIEMRDLMALIAVLYDGIAKGFADEYWQRYIDNPDTADSLPSYDGYRLKTTYGSICQYEHIGCGTIFLRTRWGMKNGLRCPICEARSDNEIFKDLVAGVSDGEYEAAEDFKGMDTKAGILHKACGKVTSIRPSRFIYLGNRCICNMRLGFDEAKERASECKNGEFELIRLNEADGKSRILHKVCNRTFLAQYHDFLRRPTCSCCNGRPNIETYRERIRSLTDGEYELNDDVANHSKRVGIKHKICGQTYAYNLQGFLLGQRCPVCGKNNRVKARNWRRIVELFDKSEILTPKDVSEAVGGNAGVYLREYAKEGKLIMVHIGYYIFADNKEYTTKDLLKTMYVERHGKIFGFFDSKSYRKGGIRVVSSLCNCKNWTPRSVEGTEFYLKSLDWYNQEIENRQIFKQKDSD